MASFARRLERCCCVSVSFFPLIIVYGLTSWAVYVQFRMGMLQHRKALTGPLQSVLGTLLYVLLNWSYSAAVFTDPGSTTERFPSYQSSYTRVQDAEAGEGNSIEAQSVTVKSSGEQRFCKKCNARKPDRAHHCSTCRRCVLKMDHHCPWLATCVGLRNYKAFLLFLIYTDLFCGLCFLATASWVWAEVVNDGRFAEDALPVNFVLLCVLSGIIGLVLTGFTAWHIYLATTGQTTIESLEKTRYLTPVRAQLSRSVARPGEDQTLGSQLAEIHANILPGVTRPEEGQDDAASSLRSNWAAREAAHEHSRYNAYLAERASESLPNAWDLGCKRNLIGVFGERPWLWCIPLPTTPCDGYHWEPSKKWLLAREQIR